VTSSAVLFDWRGTLVTTLTEEQWVREALTRLGRDTGRADDVVAAIAAANGPEDRLDGPGVDSDAALHRRTYLQVFADAGLDDVLAAALYAVESDLSLNPFADDVAETMTALRRRGVRIGVLSDLHVDLRPAFRAAGLADLVDALTLSFEQGCQKPDPRIFRAALDGLGVAAEDTLMVGDRAAKDGAAVELGMTVLLLPPLRSVSERRLHRVLALAGGCPAR
jgi:HAD superfamily hydrolase (TIGR01509 family)